MSNVINEKYNELEKYIEENKIKEEDLLKSIDEIINVIVTWYTFKYSEQKLKEIENCYSKVLKIKPILNKDDLPNYMGYIELMERIPKQCHFIIENWYKSDDYNLYILKNSYDNNYIDLYINDETSDDFITEHRIQINKYDGSVDLSCSGYLFLNEFIKNNNIKCDNKITNLSEIIKLDEIIDSSLLDLNDAVKININHYIYEEIRTKIFEIITLKLLSSSENFNVCYIRAKMFIEEFERYLNIIIDKKTMDKEVEKKYTGADQLDFYIKIFYIIYVLNPISNNNSICNYGLSLHTLKILRANSIYNLDDLITIYSEELSKEICPRDIENIRKIILEKKSLETIEIDESVKSKKIHNIFKRNR